MNFFRTPLNNQCMVGAHRGYRSIRPENTRSAFDASLGNCHFIELDIQMSSDGVAVVHHDRELGRTCNASEVSAQLGKNTMLVEAWTAEELRKLDFGGWFVDADPFGTIRDGVMHHNDLQPHIPQTIMSLAELLTWARQSAIPLNIEIKDQQGGRHDTVIVDTVLQEIRSSGYTDRILISSFNHNYLTEISAKMPEIALGALQEFSNPENIIDYLRTLGVDAYHPDAEITDENLIAELRHAGFGVNIFTVNDPEEKIRLSKEGATSLITDFPTLLS